MTDMCSKEEVREVLKQEFNGDFVKTLPVALAQLQSILESHTHVHDEILEKVNSGFAAVTARQDKANDRIKTNERMLNLAQGGMIILAMIAVPMLAWALFELVNLQQTVTNIVNDELSTYQFEVIE